MGLSEQWVARKKKVSRTVPPAERVGVRQSDEIWGEILPDVALVGAVCDLVWSNTSPEMFSWYAAVSYTHLTLPTIYSV